MRSLVYWLVSLAVLWTVAHYLSGERVIWPDAPEAKRVYATVLGAGVVVAAALRLILRGGENMRRQAVVGTAAFVTVVLGYAGREDLEDLYNRIRGNIHPSVALTTARGEAQLHRAWDGHYRAETFVNGVRIGMLVDTGATMVLIPFERAHSLGINTHTLDFSLPVTTANGQSFVAPVTLSSIKIGPIAVFDVEAAVAQPGMLKGGLLGMSFLDRLNETSFRQGRLYLRN